MSIEPSIEELRHEEGARLRAQQSKPNGIPKQRDGPGQLKALDAFAIHGADYPEPVFVAENLLPVGLTLAAGRPKVGKSWLTLEIAVAAAFGRNALGRFHVGNAKKVVYVALEEPASRTHHRLRQLVPEPDIRLQNIQFVYQIQPLMTGGAAQLDSFLTANRAELVVIDTLLALTAAHSERKDIVRGDYTEVNTLREIAEKHKAAILCVAHSRKAAGDAVDSIMGTSGTTAACDSVWQLKRQASGEATLEVKGREIEEQEYALKFNPGEPFGWQVVGEGAEVGMSQERKDILLILQQEGAQKPAAIARLLGNKNINTTRRLIQKLAYDDLVRLQSNGTYVATKPE